MGHYSIIMEILTIRVLKKLIDNVPDDYTINHEDRIGKYTKTEKIEIDMKNECIIFK